MDIPRITIAGERSGVGKSTITVGILLALQKRGMIPQPFKAGPDFLDPMHHSVLLERASRNLDTWMFPQAVEEIFVRGSIGADISVIEGVMGLYDGYDGRSEEGSTAHLSKVLRSPVILVLDASGSSRSIGAVALGFKEFDKDVNIAGVIFNHVGSQRHLEMLEDSLKETESLGGIPRVDSIQLESRHLGLVPAEEDLDRDKYERIRRTIEDNLDVDLLVDIARSADELEKSSSTEEGESETKATIGVAMDEAFNFYYQDNFDMLRRRGAEIVYFSPLHDRLPNVDGLYFGGGYPEIFAANLEQNKDLKRDVKRMSSDGMPIYAECGGMMYLCHSVTDMEGNERGMVGVFDAKVEMTKQLQALGYVEVEVLKDTPISPAGGSSRGHVFHFSRVVECNETEFAYRLHKNKGIDGRMDGFISGNTLSAYTHLHFASCPNFTSYFVESCARYRRS
jgi:cobyrinic acid a,c-diamide synthase